MIYIQRLIWDSWNVGHIARHNVTPDEVEEACHTAPLVQETHSGRFLLTGPTANGRMLAVVLDPELETGVYYPVTARSADRKERRMYAERQKGGKSDD